MGVEGGGSRPWVVWWPGDARGPADTRGRQVRTPGGAVPGGRCPVPVGSGTLCVRGGCWACGALVWPRVT